MNHSRLRLSKLSLGLIVALAAAPVFAQSTSAGVAGVVTSADGQPVPGAEVTITHVESGTVSRATTDASGRYAARGLRVGGPYTITINKSGSGTDTEDNVYLQLNQVNTVDAKLNNDVATLATVEAVGVAGASDVFSANKMGAGTNVSRQQIETLPSATGNIQDYIRLDPRITQVSKADGAISAGGQNSRYNVIRIDGVSASDPFGLESNNLPTERQPVSTEALEAINIDIANYNTDITGGTGAVVDAVTKSGTNEFHGSVYYKYRDKDMVRKDLRGVEFNGFKDEQTYGATVGGPIIKDKLFFFANYEKYVRTAPGTSLSATPYGKGTVTDADIARVQAAAQGYGFDAGTLDLPAASKTETEEKAIKLDWNINDNHRASLRYNKYEQSVLRFPLISSSQVSLSSSWYALPKTYETWVGQLFSDWSDNFSTEFKVGHKDYDAVRTPFSNLPQIQIKGFGAGDSLYLGTEQNTHVNVVGTKEDSVFGSATWYVGDHTLKGGVDYVKNDIFNYYGRNLNGVYVFNSLADFESGNPSNYQVRAPRPDGGSYGDIPAKYTVKNTGFFLQDTWAVNYNLNLMFGVRVDVPDFSEQKLYNPLIEQTYGYDNTNTVDSKLVQPRLGFNYTFDSDRPMQLRGGVGLFGGQPPNVWLAGTYQNTGLNYVEYTLTNPADLAGIFTPNVNPPYIPSTGTNPACVPVATLSSCPRANVDIAEPGLKMPSVWKANLAFEHELPWYGIVASAELLLLDTKDGIYMQRLDLSDGNGNAATAIGQDGRPIFWNASGLNPNNAGNFGIAAGTNGAQVKNYRPNGIGDVILLRNTSKGRSNQFTVGLNKPMASDWGWSLYYTHTAATDVSPITSSQNTSNWSNTLVGTVNEDTSYNSSYAIKDRFTGQLTWQHKFFGDNKTTFGMFYEGRTGRPYSYIFFNDVNGDGANTNDLFYVPNGPGDVLFSGNATQTPQQMETAFFNWLDKNPQLKRYQGQIAPGNGFNAKWVNSFDVHISQEIPGFFKGNKAEIALDIMNVGNLLNKKWGLIDDYGFFQTARVANYGGIDPATGKYVYNFSGTVDKSGIQENNNDKGNTGVSRWSIMASFKYRF